MASLDTIIENILERKGGDTETLVVANHLTQMKLFGIRQGIELYPVQDDPFKTRRRFVQELYEANKVDLHLDRWWDLLLCKGQLCFYLRPTGTSYRLYCYDSDQFRAYYDYNGDLEKVVIVYDYDVEQNLYSISKTRWVKFEITKKQITRFESENKPNLDNETGYQPISGLTPVETSQNTLGFIPCVVVNNYVISPGKKGHGEFQWLRSQIESHDDMLFAIRENIRFFGNPTLVSSRTVGELTEAVYGDRVQRPSMASQAGFTGRMDRSTRRSDPTNRDPGRGLKVMRVVGGVQGDERFGYISPDPVTPDHSQYALQYREDLHTALGGVDPRGISSGATAFEIKSLFGQAAATAKKKCEALYTYGICKVFEMALAAEELLFKRSIADAMNIVTPPKFDEKTGRSNAMTPEMVSDSMAMNTLMTGMLPDGKEPPKGFQPIGLPPLGKRTIAWRWMGPVFEDSPQDILQKSIVVRNLEEVGVETIEALKFLFADKTEQEIMSMLTGYPFREMQASAAALSQQLGILGQLLNIPNPNNPQLPLGAELNNLNIIQSTLSHAQKRLNYGLQPQPSSDAYAFTPAPGDAATLSAGAGSNPTALLSNPGASSNAAPIPAGAGYPVSPSAIAAGFNPQPIPYPSAGGNNPNAGNSAEWANPIPVPGSTISAGRTSVPEYNPAGATLPNIPGIPTDLLTHPSILAQLFPTLFGIAEPANQPQRDRVSTNQRRANPRK